VCSRNKIGRSTVSRKIGAEDFARAEIGGRDDKRTRQRAPKEIELTRSAKRILSEKSRF
jgi:hypothetical protein